MLQLQSWDIVLGHSSATIHLKNSKSGQRKGVKDVILLQDAGAVCALQLIGQKLKTTGTILQCSR
eukprot:11932564-Karenia_brevis.AAC.1